MSYSLELNIKLPTNIITCNCHYLHTNAIMTRWTTCLRRQNRGYERSTHPVHLVSLAWGVPNAAWPKSRAFLLCYSKITSDSVLVCLLNNLPNKGSAFAFCFRCTSPIKHFLFFIVGVICVSVSSISEESILRRSYDVQEKAQQCRPEGIHV